MSEPEFVVNYRSRFWCIRADVYLIVEGKNHSQHVGNVSKERSEDENGKMGDWMPATANFEGNRQHLTRSDFQLLHDILNELERIANELDTNPIVPTDNAKSDMLTDGA